MYACALTFYEVLDPLDIVQMVAGPPSQWLDETKTIYAPKCLLVLSHHPYFSASRLFLQQVYRLSLSSSPVPIERYIANFACEVPLPPPGQVQVQLTLPDRTLTIARPPVNQLPLIDVSHVGPWIDGMMPDG